MSESLDSHIQKLGNNAVDNVIDNKETKKEENCTKEERKIAEKIFHKIKEPVLVLSSLAYSLNNNIESDAKNKEEDIKIFKERLEELQEYSNWLKEFAHGKRQDFDESGDFAQRCGEGERELVGGIYHKLNNLLTGIVGYFEMYLNEKTGKSADMINKLKKAVNEFVDYSHLVHGFARGESNISTS